MSRIYNPEWLKHSPHDDDIENDLEEELSPLDDDYIPEEYRDAEDD